MNRLDELRVDVQAQLEELGTVVDEFEHTVEDIEQTLSESTLRDVENVSRTSGQAVTGD